MKATEAIIRLKYLIDKYGDGELMSGIHDDYTDLEINRIEHIMHGENTIIMLNKSLIPESGEK